MSNEKFEAQTSSIYAEQVMTNQYLHDLADDLQDEIGQRRAQFDSISATIEKLDEYVCEEIGKCQGDVKVLDALHHALKEYVEDEFNCVKEVMNATDGAIREALQAADNHFKTLNQKMGEFQADNCVTKAEILEAKIDLSEVRNQLDILINDCKEHEHAIADFGHGVVVLESKLKTYWLDTVDELSNIRSYASEGLQENNDKIKRVKKHANGLFFLLLLANAAMWICHFAGWL